MAFSHLSGIPGHVKVPVSPGGFSIRDDIVAAFKKHFKSSHQNLESEKHLI